MQSNRGKRIRAFWARRIAALWTVLALAAGGGALAAPVETVLYSFRNNGTLLGTTAATGSFRQPA